MLRGRLPSFRYINSHNVLSMTFRMNRTKLTVQLPIMDLIVVANIFMHWLSFSE